MIRRVSYFSSLIVLLASIFSCTDQLGSALDFNNGSNLGENYALVFNDTSRVVTSTVLLDSIPTSGTTVMMIGRYQDDKLGVVESQGFFQVWMGDNNSWAPGTNIEFDSLVLSLTPSGYYYGDTTNVQNFEVRQITDDFQTYNIAQSWVKEGYYSRLYTPYSLYNTSHVDYNNNETLGTFSVRPKPHKKDSITVRLKDELGKAWLADALNTQVSNFVSNSAFIDYFKGMTIKSVGGNGTYILGLATKDMMAVRFYYHENGGEQIKGKHVNFSFSPYGQSLPYLFNKISGDRSSVPGLANLSNLKREVPSRETNEETYIQAGVGVVTKIRFPYVKDLLNLPGNIQLNDARLIVEPIKGSYNGNVQLPPQLILMGTDLSNFPITYLLADQSSSLSQLAEISTQTAPQTASIGLDYELNTNTGYVFRVTQYIQYLMNSQQNLNNQGLLLSMPVADLETTTRRIVIGSGQRASYRVRLEIYYLAKKE